MAIEIIHFPIQHCDFPLCKRLPEGKPHESTLNHHVFWVHFSLELPEAPRCLQASARFTELSAASMKHWAKLSLGRPILSTDFFRNGVIGHNFCRNFMEKICDGCICNVCMGYIYIFIYYNRITWEMIMFFCCLYICIFNMFHIVHLYLQNLRFPSEFRHANL